MKPLPPEEEVVRAGAKITVWKPRPRPVDVDAARLRAEEMIEAFMRAIAARMKPVQAMRAATGIGKTRIAARILAEAIRELGITCLYLVPTHKLGSEIADRFPHDIKATVFRGRHAADPEQPGKTMCLDLEAVDTALELGESVSTSCCRGKDQSGNKAQCQFFDSCAYQRQKRGKPNVWIAAHEMLLHPEKAFGKVDVVIVDEGFWQAAIVKPARKGITIEEIRQKPPQAKAISNPLDDLAEWRRQLARGLERHDSPGGLQRAHLVAEGLTPDLCTEAIKHEWRLKPTAEIWPGMPPEQRRTAKAAAKGVKHIRRRVALWRAVRELLERDDDKRSGRAFIEITATPHGDIKIVKTRGLQAVTKALADKPTLMMDATLPGENILETIYPDVEIVAEIEATMPNASIRYVAGAPVSASKLVGRPGGKPPAEQPIRSIRRYVLRRWLEHGRPRTLVIMQKGAEERLKALGLPDTISAEHFNNIEGLDGYKHVRLLIVVGRTQPAPFDVENDAAALSGVEPTPANTAPNGSTWFDAAKLDIVMKDGSIGPSVTVDRHPDPLAEAIRHQICEAQLVQAIGRARAVNRTKADPVSIDILADVSLPEIPADEVLAWEAPSKVVEMAVEGIILTSTSDMVAAWPNVWGNRESARDAIKEILAVWEGGTAPTFPCNKSYYQGFVGSVRYQHKGERQKWRKAWFNPDVLPDVRSWLEARIGPLAGFEVDTAKAAQPEADAQPEAPAEGRWHRWAINLRHPRVHHPKGPRLATTLVTAEFAARPPGPPVMTRVAVTRTRNPEAWWRRSYRAWARSQPEAPVWPHHEG